MRCAAQFLDSQPNLFSARLLSRLAFKIRAAADAPKRYEFPTAHLSNSDTVRAEHVQLPAHLSCSTRLDKRALNAVEGRSSTPKVKSEQDWRAVVQQHTIRADLARAIRCLAAQFACRRARSLSRA